MEFAPHLSRQCLRNAHRNQKSMAPKPIDAVEPIRVACSGTDVTVAEPKVPNQIYLASSLSICWLSGCPWSACRSMTALFPIMPAKRWHFYRPSGLDTAA